MFNRKQEQINSLEYDLSTKNCELMAEKHYRKCENEVAAQRAASDLETITSLQKLIDRLFTVASKIDGVYAPGNSPYSVGGAKPNPQVLAQWLDWVEESNKEKALQAKIAEVVAEKCPSKKVKNVR